MPGFFIGKASRGKPCYRPPIRNFRNRLRGLSVNRSALSVILATFCAILLPNAALACACCSNPGQRNVKIEKVSAGRLDEIRKLRFQSTAQLFLAERDPGDVKGIERASEKYELAVDQQKDSLLFSFRDGKNEGTLALVHPETISIFEVDPRDGRQSGAGGPLLYKEWRLSANFAGTGIFKSGNGGYQRITLIVQGQGNSCTSAADFTHWALTVHGPAFEYSFFGDLAR